VSTFQFGTEIDIEPHGLCGAILVTTAVRGSAGMTAGGRSFAAAPGLSFVSQEEDRPVFRYDSGTEVLKLRFERRHIEETYLKMHGDLPDKTLRFDSMMAAGQPALRWQALLRYVVTSLNTTEATVPNPAETAGIEDLLMLTLLGIQPHNLRPRFGAAVRTVSPRQFRVAIDYIDQYLDADITLADIAAAAGCSIRSLARAFHQAGDTSPMQHVQKLRLQRIREELLQASADRTIAEIAYHWGYRHLGEFNRKYREGFGETPSTTRQRMLGRC
jgi:AraC-like DNA-binding protein